MVLLPAVRPDVGRSARVPRSDFTASTIWSGDRRSRSMTRGNGLAPYDARWLLPRQDPSKTFEPSPHVADSETECWRYHGAENEDDRKDQVVRPLSAALTHLSRAIRARNAPRRRHPRRRAPHSSVAHRGRRSGLITQRPASASASSIAEWPVFTADCAAKTTSLT